MIESDADRLAMVQAVGERFSTGHATPLLGIFDQAYLETELSDFTVANREPMLLCRTSDVATHGLIKQSKVTRVSDGVDYFVVDLEPDGTGLTLLRLRK